MKMRILDAPPPILHCSWSPYLESLPAPRLALRPTRHCRHHGRHFLPLSHSIVRVGTTTETETPTFVQGIVTTGTYTTTSVLVTTNPRTKSSTSASEKINAAIETTLTDLDAAATDMGINTSVQGKALLERIHLLSSQVTLSLD